MRILLNSVTSAIVILLFAAPSSAQVVSNNGFFKGNFVEAGIQPSGAFGSLVPAPSDYISATKSKYSGRVGFIADVGKDGFTVGNPPFIGDFFVPGTPYEAFSVKMNGTLYENAGSSAQVIPGNVTRYTNDGSTATIHWLGSINNLQIRQETSVGKSSSYILIRVFLKNTGSSTINNIFYTRSVDPDNEKDNGSSYTTRNTIEEQNPNSTSTALVSGRGLLHNSYLGLGSRDCRARVAIMSSFSSDGEHIFNGTGQVALKTKNATNEADNAIAVAFNLGNLAPGDSTAIAMAYVLNAADLPPAMDETDPLFNVKADSYASGSVINVCSGSTATLNIVNGDGYNWTWSPSTGLNKTTGRSVQASLTGDITYTASGVNSCGTTRSISLSLHPEVAEDPDAAGSISGPSTVYKGWNATFSVPAIAHATDYKWSIPEGASFVSGYGTNTIVVKFGTTAVSGTVSVYGENSCGAGTASSFNVTVNTASSFSISSANSGTPLGAVFSTPTVIDNQINITGTDPITNTRVYLDAGFQAGDELIYDGELPAGVTSSYSPETGALSFTGTATSTQWKDIFRNVKFRTSSANTADRSVKFILGDLVSYTIGGKPHYYEYIQPSGYPSWTEAYNAAAGRTFFGLAGYLATITSSAENDLIKQKLSSDGWVGGSDDYRRINEARGTSYTTQSQTEGMWYWVNGPEAGTLISTGNNSPVVASGGFMNWAANEPNNAGSNENFMQLYSTQNGKWNDLPGTAQSSVPGFVVEYGGYSSDPTISIEYSRTIKSKPAAPVITAISEDSGTETDDFITSDKTLIISGTAIANSTVKITRTGSGVIGTVTANSSGVWSFDYTATTLGEGSYEFNATATVSGVESSASATITVKIDATAPEKPTKPSLENSAESFTKETKPSFEGTAEAGALVNLYSGTSLIGSAVADNEGKWTIVPTGDLTEDQHSISVEATDTAGNTSVSSDIFSLTVDFTAPEKPEAPVMNDGDGKNTNNNKPTINGVTEPNTTVHIYVDGDSITTVSADASGNWSYTFSESLKDGAHSITTSSSDAAGNTSEKSNALEILVDTQSPATPGAPALSGETGNIINTNTPTITGTAEPGSDVTVFVNGNIAVTVTADEAGNWEYTFSPALTDDEYEISVTAKDKTGNTSEKSESLTITIDTKKPDSPGQPVIESEHNNGNSKHNKPVIGGYAEPGSVIRIYDGTELKGSATAGTDGKWSFEFDVPLADGEHEITVKAEDAAGNISDASTSVIIKVDTERPDTPGKASLTGDKNGNTNNNTPTIEGEAEPNSTVTIYNNGMPVATITADGDGNWSYTFDPALSDGGYSITTTSTDAAGNTSLVSEPVSFTVDTQKPVTPSSPAVTEAGNNGHLKNSRPTIEGKAEPGSTISVYDNGHLVGTVVADTEGNWTYTFDPALTEGEHNIHVTVTDNAGNISSPGAPLWVSIDTNLPTVEVAANKYKVVGPYEVTVTFSEPVSGFDQADVKVINGTASGFTIISPSEYKVTIIPAYDNANTSVQIVEGAASDESGNGNASSNILSHRTEFMGVLETVYPNPASTVLNVKFKGVTPVKGRVTLVKMSGQVVHDQDIQFSNSTLKIDVSRYAAGQYILIVKANQFVHHVNVLIVR